MYKYGNKQKVIGRKNDSVLVSGVGGGGVTACFLRLAPRCLEQLISFRTQCFSGS